jgi:hypothetical protein
LTELSNIQPPPVGYQLHMGGAQQQTLFGGFNQQVPRAANDRLQMPSYYPPYYMMGQPGMPMSGMGQPGPMVGHLSGQMGGSAAGMSALSGSMSGSMGSVGSMVSLGSLGGMSPSLAPLSNGMLQSLQRLGTAQSTMGSSAHQAQPSAPGPAKGSAQMFYQQPPQLSGLFQGQQQHQSMTFRPAATEGAAGVAAGGTAAPVAAGGGGGGGGGESL